MRICQELESMDEIRTKLGEDGRLLIPAAQRKALGLRPGEPVVLRVERNELRVVSVRHAAQRAKDRVKGMIKGEEPLSDYLIRMRRAEAARD
jgi:AbrB family looped-hinge helix DNA binding protein